MSLQSQKSLRQRGFTIVELIVVVVIIAILATIVIVAYNGVTNRAKTSKAAATASSVVKKMEVYNAEIGNYPATYSLLTGAATSTAYYIPAAAYTLKTTALVNGGTTENETYFNYASCVTPSGYRVTVWDYTNSAVAHTYYAGATSASTCTLITS